MAILGELAVDVVLARERLDRAGPKRWAAWEASGAAGPTAPAGAAPVEAREAEPAEARAEAGAVVADRACGAGARTARTPRWVGPATAAQATVGWPPTAVRRRPW